MADSPRQSLALARTAARAAGSLNRATPGELIGELPLAVAGLPQLLAQAGGPAPEEEGESS